MTMTATVRRDSRAAHSPHPLFFKPAASSWHRNVRRADFSLHAYVGADPVNWTDPHGLAPNEIIINAPPRPQNPPQPPRIGTFGPVSPGAGGNPERGEDDSAADCPEEENCVLVTAKKKPSRLTRIIRSIGNALENVAERIKPPQGRRRGESFEDCVRRVAPEVDDLLEAGTAAVLAGYGFKSLYPYRSPGSGTSVISILSREAFGSQRMSIRRFGTMNLGGAVGRVASNGSVVIGAAAAGLGIGKVIGGVEICR